MSSIKEITKNTAYMGILKVFTMVIGFITSIIVVRYLGPEKYGIYSLILFIGGAMAVFANLGLNQALPRYVAELKAKNNYKLIHTLVDKSVKYRLLILIVLSFLLISFSNYLSVLLKAPVLDFYLKVAGFLLIPQILLTIFTSAYSGLQKFAYIAKTGIVMSLVNFVLILLFIQLNLEILGLLLSLFFSNLLVIFLFHYDFRKFPKDESQKDSTFKGRIKKFALISTAIGFIDYIVWNNSGVFFLGLFRPAAEVGYFNIAYTLPALIMLNLPNIFFSVLFPVLAESHSSSGFKKIREMFPTAMKFIAILLTPIFVFSIIFADSIIKTLYGSAFAPAILPFQLLMLSTFITNIFLISSTILYAIERADINLKTDIIALIFVIITSFVFMPAYGLIAAALIFAITQAITIFVQGLSSSHIIKSRIPLLNIMKVLLLNIVIVLPFLLLPNNSIILLAPSAILFYAISLAISLKLLLTQEEKEKYVYKQLDRISIIKWFK